MAILQTFVNMAKEVIKNIGFPPKYFPETTFKILGESSKYTEFGKIGKTKQQQKKTDIF